MNPHDRAIGTLLGLACGDAVGTTLEFRAPGTFEPITDMVGGGPFRLQAGQWTDDTSMALCLAESLLDRGALDLEDQLCRYALWHDTGYLSSNGRCFDIGFTTHSQIARFQATGEAIDPRPDEESAANGSLMRLGAVPIRWHRDPEAASEFSGESSRSTHAASEPGRRVSAHGRHGQCTHRRSVLRRGGLADVLAVGRPAPRGHGHRRRCVEGKGAARDTRHRLLHRRARSRAVVRRRCRRLPQRDLARGEPRRRRRHDSCDRRSARRRGWGASGIPVSWREKVVAAERIVALAGGLFAAGGGEFDNGTWPHDDFVHAWWVQPGRLLAGEYPSHIDPTRARHKVDLLVDAGVRTFVDLTTSADQLDPYLPFVADVAEARCLDVRHERFPIPDLGVVDDHQYDEVAQTIEHGLARGVVYVHCWGGIGRTGTVIGCLLADEGLDYDAIIERLTTLRAARRKADRPAPEMKVQHELIKRRVARQP